MWIGPIYLVLIGIWCLQASFLLMSLSENHSAPPDVTGYTNNTANTTTTDGIQVERAPGGGNAAQRQTPKYGNAELMETGDGERTLKRAAGGRGAVPRAEVVQKRRLCVSLQRPQG